MDHKRLFRPATHFTKSLYKYDLVLKRMKERKQRLSSQQMILIIKLKILYFRKKNYNYNPNSKSLCLRCKKKNRIK